MLKFIERDFIKVALICLLCVASLTDARKAAGAKRGGGSKFGSSSRVSKPQAPQQSSPPKYANPNIAQLSYSPSQQSAPVRPSAPVADHSSSSVGTKPIGWNTGHDSPAVAVNKPPVNSAPYPTNTGFNHPAPPPSYSQYPHGGAMNGPPPPYSAQPQPGLQSRFNEAPPAYSPHNPNPGYPVQPGLGQPGYGQAGGFGQPGGYGAAPYPGAPMGGAAGYPQQPQAGFGAPAGQPPTIINNYHQAPQGGSSGGGSGLTNALAGGALAFGAYNAFKPSEPKVVHNTIIQQVAANSSEAPATNSSEPALAPLEVAAPVQLAPYPSSPAPSDMSSEMVPLAPMVVSSSTMYPSLPPVEMAATPEMPAKPDMPTTMADAMPTTMADAMPTTAPPQAMQSSPEPSSHSQFSSSLAPLTTFAAMANDAETNKTSVEVPAMPPMTNPTMAPMPSTTSQEPAMANALSNNQEAQKKMDSGSNSIRTSLLSVIVVPLMVMWVRLH